MTDAPRAELTTTPTGGSAFDALTDKHKSFVAAYLVHFNATRAAIEAGYAERGANVQGHTHFSG